MYIFLGVFGCIVFALVGSAGNCGDPEVVSGVITMGEGVCWARGGMTALSFLIGGLTSMLSGYLGMRVAVYTNARTTISAVRKTLGEDEQLSEEENRKAEEMTWVAAFNTAFKGGAVMGFSLCSLGMVIL